MEVTFKELTKIAGDPSEIQDWKDKEKFQLLIEENRLVTEHVEGNFYYYKIGWGFVNRLIYWEFPQSIPTEITSIQSETFDSEDYE